MIIQRLYIHSLLLSAALLTAACAQQEQPTINTAEASSNPENERAPISPSKSPPMSAKDMCVLDGGAEVKAPAPKGLFFGGMQFSERDIEEATPGFDQFSNAPIVHIRFTEFGAGRLAALTKSSVGKVIPVYFDGKLLECPRVNEAILGGQLQMAGNFTSEQANELAIRLSPKMRREIPIESTKK
jgi:preprotein translocase subunit SecD